MPYQNDIIQTQIHIILKDILTWKRRTALSGWWLVSCWAVDQRTPSGSSASDTPAIKSLLTYAEISFWPQLYTVRKLTYGIINSNCHVTCRIISLRYSLPDNFLNPFSQGHSNVKLQLAATFCISNLIWNEEDGKYRFPYEEDFQGDQGMGDILQGYW